MDLSVNIEEIKHGELRVERALPADWVGEVLGGDEPTGFTALGPGQLLARLTRLATSYLLQADARVRVAGPCKRCLAEVTFDVPARFTLNLVQDAQPSQRAGRDTQPDDEAPAGTFEPEDADEEHFHGKVIDLGRIVREQLLLALPMDALCSEGCKGLCMICGNNLNERECGCERRPVDPRWAGLKNIKL